MAQDQHRDEAPDHAGAVAHDATEDHGDEPGHDDHAQTEEPLGPLDVPAWVAGIAGVLLGLAVAVAFMLATAPVGAA